MLSILIPVYNSDPGTLVNDLRRLGQKSGFPFEIIIGNDGSDKMDKQFFDAYIALPEIRVVHNLTNTGRSSIRNLLAKEARYPFFLFVDSDARVVCSDYLMNFFSFCRKGKFAVCGGVSYLDNPPEQHQKRLRWLYGTKREMKKANVRMKSPYQSFSVFNVFLSAEVFKTVQFNEQLYEYGHEDTLFGLELERNKIEVIHIDNPLCHEGLDDADLFLKKTREGVRNLIRLQEESPFMDFETNRLMSLYRLLKAFKIVLIIKLFIKQTFRLAENNLLGMNPRLFLYDVYKLLYMISLRTTE
jgi:glycosyltransferase involved in cell wall biosynthesis